ncbi:heterokaryon incompatibility protein-domain-containing protein [Xylaria bambusicola]|uniref:heterokaryon incompatibility protein-domain-containing protein n=1 Tax=Xylaria bambusicola TaxID=326684 RepID=UPI002007EF63|nr:heterokaryon incompatibility protein-domain-containing protein [Xylaria bambusicola]KAI0514663.1 heterokaryon incompatibility protein-domain-containing protein [Xylaria bambusicola]
MGEEEAAKVSPVAWGQHLYLQTRLKEKNGRIRLLTIQPHQYTVSRPEVTSDSIHCFLRLADLKQRPQFTVVSHRWHPTDAADETKSLFVNGAPVPASTGLFEVLHQLQRETEPVVVWIDALCINHADEDEREKSVQVSQLAQIYSAAEKTFVYLGATSDRSDEAMKVLRRLADEQLTLNAFIANWTPQLGHQLVQKMLPARFVHSSAAENKEPLELQQELDSLRAPLKALMERDYWTDLWSLVELCLSHRGLVVCGKHALPLDHFYSAARALDHIINHLTYSKWLAAAMNPATSSAQSTVLSGEEVSNISQSPALRILGRRDEYRRDADSWLKALDSPLFTLLSRFYAETQLPLRVSDPRDRVYALACLATDISELGLNVDYHKDVDAVYAETSAAFLQKHPRVLQLARGTLSAGDNLTSWAIDWGNMRPPPPSTLSSSERPFNACGPADSRFYRAELSASNQITLKAAVVDKVQEIGTPYQVATESESESETKAKEDASKDEVGDGDKDEKERQRTYLSEIKQFWEESTASLNSPYFAEQAAVALAKIPVGDIEVNPASGALVRASTLAVEGYKRTYEALFPAETESIEDDAREMDKGIEEEVREGVEKLSLTPSIPYTMAMARMVGRRPFRSNNGYVGLGPTDLAVADTIAIPYGSCVPFAFRRVGGEGEGEDVVYRLVGEVYVFGIMDGEFMKVHRQESVLRVV